MGLLSKISGYVPGAERQGICLDTSKPFWELSGPCDFPLLLRALERLLDEDCTLYFEGGSPCGSLVELLRKHSAPAQSHLALGTIWPRPRIDHVPATSELLAALAAEMERRAEPELAIHFHVYRAGTVLLEWHDAFSQPMLLAGEFTEDQVGAFAERAGMRYKQCAGMNR